MSPTQTPFPAGSPPPPPPVAQSTTREIPVVPAAGPSPAAVQDGVPAPPEAEPATPVPGPGGTVSTQAVSAPKRTRVSALAWRPRTPRPSGALAGPALVAVALAALETGLSVHGAGGALWSRVPLWAAFATASCVLGFAAFADRAPGRRQLLAGRGWGAAAAGLIGLVVFWVLVALPSADTDRGFLLTAALGCSGAALWIAGGGDRRRPAAAEPVPQPAADSG